MVVAVVVCRGRGCRLPQGSRDCGRRSATRFVAAAERGTIVVARAPRRTGDRICVVDGFVERV